MQAMQLTGTSKRHSGQTVLCFSTVALRCISTVSVALFALGVIAGVDECGSLPAVQA